MSKKPSAWAQRVVNEIMAELGEQKKPKLPGYAVADIEAGRFTVAELFECKAIPGSPADYNLSGFTPAQLSG